MRSRAPRRVNAIVALWVPLFLLSALVLRMYYVLAYKPGGQPIGALERFAGKAAKIVRNAAAVRRRRKRRGGGDGMINFSFFPSRQLASYMARLFVTRTFAVLVMLVLVLMTLDLLGEAGKILAVPGNGDADLWRYVGLRIPLLISRFLPFSALLGTLIAFVGLNQNSEIVAMKAAGLSAHQILAPLIIASMVVAAGLFAFNETVVVKAARTVTAWSDNDYKPIPPESGILSNVWVLQGDNLVHAGIVAGHGATSGPAVSIYDRSGRRAERGDPSAERASAPHRATGGSRTSKFTTPAMNVVRRDRGMTRCRASRRSS